MDSEHLLRILMAADAVRSIAARLDETGLPQVHLIGGALAQTYWNTVSGRTSGESIRDYDLTYFDGDDLSPQSEAENERRVATMFAGLGIKVDVKNQARVHEWYPARYGAPYPQLRSAEEGIALIPIVAVCVGLRRTTGQDGLVMLAPHGLADIEAGILRRNPHCPSPSQFAPKALSYCARWPWLRIVDEGQTISDQPDRR